MFGPFFSSTSVPSLAGGTSIMVLMISFFGYLYRGYLIPKSFSRSRGSVIFPVSAEAAPVSGLIRYTRSSSVPERLGKFLGTVRRLMVSDAGDRKSTPLNYSHV